VALLRSAPGTEQRRGLWSAGVAGWQERSGELAGASSLTAEQLRGHAIAELLLADWKAEPADVTLLRAGILLGLSEPREWAERMAFSGDIPAEQRVRLLEVLLLLRDERLAGPSLTVLKSGAGEAVRAAALRVLANSGADESVADELIELHRQFPESGLSSSLRDVLLSRPMWARSWLRAVDSGRIPAAWTSLEQIRRVALFGDAELDELVAKHWGRLHGVTREDRLAEVRRLNNDLRAGTGDAAAGRELFRRHCAACHQLFGEGGRVGPDLTTANRQDRDFLLISLVDPGSVIRREYVSVVVQTKSGRVLTGLPISRSESLLVLADSKGERQEIATAEIEELSESGVSLMPEELYRQLKPQQLRDLFAYLMSVP
jgi:putative heme-binding domain-containing protein